MDRFMSLGRMDFDTIRKIRDRHERFSTNTTITTSLSPPSQLTPPTPPSQYYHQHHIMTATIIIASASPHTPLSQLFFHHNYTRLTMHTVITNYNYNYLITYSTILTSLLQPSQTCLITNITITTTPSKLT